MEKARETRGEKREEEENHQMNLGDQIDKIRRGIEIWLRQGVTGQN